MLTLYLAVLLGGNGPHAAPPLRTPAPETRALAWLAREVPRWKKENGCYSCHHNGDAARTLYIAVRSGQRVDTAALADTTDWLKRPGDWDRNGGQGPFNDKKMARLQFASALAEAHAAGLLTDPRPLEQAARYVADLQDRDGAWKVLAEGTLGSPTTHGTALATHLARRTLQVAGRERHRDELTRADRWVRRASVVTVLDAAGVLLALEKATDSEAVAQRRRCLELIRKGEARGGGWGPYLDSPPEVFDTALVLLALKEQDPTARSRGWLERGRRYLLAEQETDGAWPETTRPSGAESYAQKLSTTGWATLALLATRK
jgi:hypothetical protein